MFERSWWKNRAAVTRSAVRRREGMRPRHACFEPLEERRVLDASDGGGLTVIIPPNLPFDTSGIVGSLFPWHNSSNYVDVSGTDGVTPHDALLLVNELLRNGIHELPAVSASVLPPPYYDVNADGLISAADAIAVINQLLEQNKLDASGAPNTALVLPGTYQAGVPTTVRFIDARNRVIAVPARNVTDTSVETVIPPYYDDEHNQFRSDVMSVEVAQQGLPVQQIYTKFLIEDLSSFDAFQNGLAFHLVWDLQGLTNLNLVDYRRIAAIVGAEDAPAFDEFESLLQAELQQLETMWRAGTSIATGPINLFTDANDPNLTQFSLSSAWTRHADRQVAGWLRTVTGATEPVDVADLRDYLSSFVVDARQARANGDAAALARTREQLGELQNLATSVIASAVALENEVVSGNPELQNIAALEAFLAVNVAGLAVMADLQIVAGELRGPLEADYRGAIAELAHNGLREVLQFGGAALADLVPSGNSTVGAALLQYGNVLGDALSALHHSNLPNNFGELGALFDAAFSEISAGLTPVAPAVNVVLFDPLQTNPTGRTATFHVQLATRPTAPVTVKFTTTAPSDSSVTAAIEFAPDEWMQLWEVIVTGKDDGVFEGIFDYFITIEVESADPAYDGLIVASVPVRQNDGEGTLVFL
jgi:hypothetical protein